MNHDIPRFSRRYAFALPMLAVLFAIAGCGTDPSDDLACGFMPKRGSSFTVARAYWFQGNSNPIRDTVRITTLDNGRTNANPGVHQHLDIRHEDSVSYYRRDSVWQLAVGDVIYPMLPARYLCDSASLLWIVRLPVCTHGAYADTVMLCQYIPTPGGNAVYRYVAWNSSFVRREGVVMRGEAFSCDRVRVRAYYFGGKPTVGSRPADSSSVDFWYARKLGMVIRSERTGVANGGDLVQQQGRDSASLQTLVGYTLAP